MIFEKISLRTLILLNPVKSTLQLGIGILENGFNVDVMFPVIRNHGTMDNTQAARLDFDDFTMDKTYDRAWGPGLMYEMAIPLAMFLGCKEIITVGWDIGDISKFSGDKNT